MKKMLSIMVKAVEKLDRKLTRAAMQLLRIRTGANGPIHPKNFYREDTGRIWFREFLPGEGRKVLDLGAGSGGLSLVALGAGCDVTAVETGAANLKLLESIRASHSAGRLSIVPHDLETTPYPFPDAAFDAVISCDVIEHLHGRLGHVREIARVLKKGGVLVFAAPNRCTPWKRIKERLGVSPFSDDDHKVEYSREELMQELSAGKFSHPVRAEPVVLDLPINGLIDLLSALSGGLYVRAMRWKHAVASRHPEWSSGFRMIFVKE